MRHAQHLQITLHQTVLAGGSVLHDVSIVKLHLLTTHYGRKISLAYLRTFPLRDEHPFLPLWPVCLHDPLAEAGENFIDGELSAVDLRSGKLSASNGNLPLRRVASVYHCYIIQIHMFPFRLRIRLQIQMRHPLQPSDRRQVHPHHSSDSARNCQETRMPPHYNKVQVTDPYARSA